MPCSNRLIGRSVGPKEVLGAAVILVKCNQHGVNEGLVGLNALAGGINLGLLRPQDGLMVWGKPLIVEVPPARAMTGWGSEGLP